MKDKFYKLILITNRNNTSIDEYLHLIKICITSGITCVQLREKHSSYAALLTFGHALKEVLLPAKIPLIINDNVDLALALDAEGVHLGQSDSDIWQARKRLGSDKIIGLSVNTLTQVFHANGLPVNYIGCGAIFATLNKDDVIGSLGLNGLQQLSLHSKHPIIAVGGVNVTNAELVLQAGANGIAAIGAFHDTNNIATMTAQLKSIVEESQCLNK